MKHTESCVASIGHFDNHTCWQVQCLRVYNHTTTQPHNHTTKHAGRYDVLESQTKTKTKTTHAFKIFNIFVVQHGKDNSAHKEGMKIMIDEIEYLSKGDLDKGHIMVTYDN